MPPEEDVFRQEVRMAQVVGVLDSAEVAAIRAARQKIGAVRAGDWESAAQVYDERAVVMPAHSEPLDTTPKIRAYLEDYPKIVRIDLTEIEIEGRMDLAYERGRYELVAGGISDHGSHFTLWRKQNDGSWKVYRDIWHSDRPA